MRWSAWPWDLVRLLLRSSLAICSSFRSSSISIMCRRKQRPPSRKRPLSWGRRPKRSLDSRKPLGEATIRGSLGSWTTKGPTKTLWTWPYLSDHFSFSDKPNALVMHPILYPIIYPIWSPILYPKLHPNYIPNVCFFWSHFQTRPYVIRHIAVYTRWYSQCFWSFRGTTPQVTQIFGWYKSPFLGGWTPSLACF